MAGSEHRGLAMVPPCTGTQICENSHIGVIFRLLLAFDPFFFFFGPLGPRPILLLRLGNWQRASLCARAPLPHVRPIISGVSHPLHSAWQEPSLIQRVSDPSSEGRRRDLEESESRCPKPPWRPLD